MISAVSIAASSFAPPSALAVRGTRVSEPTMGLAVGEKFPAVSGRRLEPCRWNLAGLNLSSLAVFCFSPSWPFPQTALKDFGVSGKKAVIFFYGAVSAPELSTPSQDLFTARL